MSDIATFTIFSPEQDLELMEIVEASESAYAAATEFCKRYPSFQHVSVRSRIINLRKHGKRHRIAEDEQFARAAQDLKELVRKYRADTPTFLHKYANVATNR